METERERIKEFLNVQTQIQKICGEIAGGNQQPRSPKVDESDLSLKKLDEYNDQLQELQKEKSDRLHKVLEFVSNVHDLCAVLGINFYIIVTEVHPSLNDAIVMQSKSISNDTLARLAKIVLALEEDKRKRLKKYAWMELYRGIIYTVDTVRDQIVGSIVHLEVYDSNKIIHIGSHFLVILIVSDPK